MAKRGTNTERKSTVSATDWYAGKVSCPECGLPRDPEYAKRAPCSCCGHIGLARPAAAQAHFTEDGDLMDETIAAREVLTEEVLGVAPPTEEPTAVEVVVGVQDITAGKRHSKVSTLKARAARAVTKPPKAETLAEPKVASVADLFLAF